MFNVHQQMYSWPAATAVRLVLAAVLTVKMWSLNVSLGVSVNILH